MKGVCGKAVADLVDSTIHAINYIIITKYYILYTQTLGGLLLLLPCSEEYWLQEWANNW